MRTFNFIFLKVHQKRKPMMCLIYTSVSVLYVNFSIIYTSVENSMTLRDKQTHGRSRKGHNSRSTNIQGGQLPAYTWNRWFTVLVFLPITSYKNKVYFNKYIIFSFIVSFFFISGCWRDGFKGRHFICVSSVIFCNIK